MNNKLDTIDIIIVNWNSGLQLSYCIKSIIDSKTDGFKYKIIIVDNGSIDGSLIIDNKFQDVVVIKNNKNLGFGAACNQAIKLSNSKFILLLNPDAEIKVNTLSICFDLMNSNLNWSVLGLKQIRSDGSVLKSCSRFPSLKQYFNQITGLSILFPSIFPQNIMAEWDHNSSKIVDHVMGSFMFIRREILEDVGYFDEAYFVYLEDIDLSKRIANAGGIVFFNSDNSIIHEGGGTSSQIIATRTFYSLHSRLVYINKYFSFVEKVIIYFLMIFIEPLTRIVYLVVRGDFAGFFQTISAYIKLIKKLFFNAQF